LFPGQHTGSDYSTVGEWGVSHYANTGGPCHDYTPLLWTSWWWV